MNKIIYIVVKLFGIISLFFTVLFAFLTLSALMDRINNGPGIMFADVELLLIITILFLLLSIIIFFTAKRIKNGNQS